MRAIAFAMCDALHLKPATAPHSGETTMFDSYRAWLESELRLLGNASHHAYSIGQANMAKRALDRFDEAVREGTDSGASPVALSLGVDETRLAIDALASLERPEPALATLRARLGEALGRHEDARSAPVAGASVRPLDPETLARTPGSRGSASESVDADGA